MTEKLEKPEHEKYVAERKLTAAKYLETFLKAPALLTDDDVMQLLTFLFHSEAAQKKLDMLIKERKKTLTMYGG